MSARIKEVHKMIGAIIAKRKARASFECLNRRDIDGFLADWAEDAHFFHPGNVPGISGETETKEAAREWFQKFMDRSPSMIMSPNSICVQKLCPVRRSNVVTVEWDIDLRDVRDQEWQNKGITVISVEKGKVVLVRNYIFDLEVHAKAWGEA